jgi:methionyl-tRNA formyltransferase
MTKLIALIVEDDTVFALPAWHRAIALLERRGLLVTHVAVIPPRIDQYGGVFRSLWYSSVFGFGNAFRLSLFAAIEKRRRKGEPRTWEEMAHTHALVVRRFEDPNSIEAQTFLRSSQCDVLHVLAPVLLSATTLDIPGTGVIAHHPSMLPSCRGMFPYFWARLRGEPIGQSLHQVTPQEPSSGPILAQAEARARVTGSMLSFQIWAARRYPEMALDATQRLLARRSLPGRDGLEASYCGLPTRRDRVEFEQRGGCVSKWRDLRLTVSSRKQQTSEPEEAQRGTAYQFPEVLPLRVTESASPGKVIQMQRRG